MSQTPPRDPAAFCPYKGLQPYEKRDRRYFFGRDRDTEIITANLHTAPVTVLYGASGVGKSSVLLAGVVPVLERTERVVAVVFREWQSPGYLPALKQAVLEAARRQHPGVEFDVDTALPLDKFLRKCGRAARSSVFLILDQFEEYFLYHPASEATEEFEAEFARTVNRREVRANFLLAMRDDGLSKLDRFKPRIPSVMGNLLRLEHLERDAAEQAIRRPLDEYNREFAVSPPFGVEDGHGGGPDLVGRLLEDLKAGKVTLDLTGQGQVSPQTPGADPRGRIETPFLQMVLTRLWEEERRAGSRVLRLGTYEDLGGATPIVRSHLDKVMDEKLSNGDEREVAARLFHFLVTPGGMKIAHTLDDLASYAELPAARVAPVVKLLSSSDVRVVRPVPPPLDQRGEDRYEIFHDVLAPAVLDWRARHLKTQADARAAAEAEARLAEERAESERLAAEQRRQLAAAQKEAASARLLRRLVYVAAGLLVVASGSIIFGLSALDRAWNSEEELRKERDKATDKAQKAEDKAQTAEVQLSRSYTATTSLQLPLSTPSPSTSATPEATPAQVSTASPLTADVLRAVMPNAPADRRTLYLPYIQKAMDEFQIDTPLRQAAFLAQLAYESGEFRFMEEPGSGDIYEKRRDLGNTEEGDGRRYKGRGAFQIVGRANYQRFGELLGLDLVNHPELAATPEVTFRISGLFWKSLGLNELADRQDFKAITKRINGGYLGLDERLAYYDRAERALGVSGGGQKS